MAKGKTRTGVPNKNLHARISFLQQAATYLSLQSQQHAPSESQQLANVVHTRYRRENEPSWKPGDELDEAAKAASHSVATVPQQQITSEPATTVSGNFSQQHLQSNQSTTFNRPSSGGLPQHLTTHLRQVAQKSTIRLHPNVKHSICRTCSAVLLVESQTCRKYVENLSRGGRKAHADVLVLACEACGAVKRFPVGAKRQRRKGLRASGGEGEAREGGAQVKLDAADR